MGDLLLSGEELTVKRLHPANLPTKGEKEFKPKNDWLEKRQLVTQLDERFNFISSQRIEKANAISQAEWIPSLKKAKVTKKVGNMWQTFGHHQDQEDWLLPEEALFLVENCELELMMGEVRMSVERCTVLALESEEVTWEEYRVFSFLIRSGMTVVRHSPELRVTNYERNLVLDLSQQKKLSLPGCSNETIIDEDISIIEYLGDLGKKEKRNEEVIIIDDDAEDSNDKCVEVKYDKESSSSGVSPERLSREWYLPVAKFLSNCWDDVIDLCNEEDDKEEISNYRTAITTKREFSLQSKQNILNILPSAQNGISYIKAPDPRLLPRTVFPKYSEYKVNLNVRNAREVRHRQPWFNRQYRPAPRRMYQVSRPIVNTFNRSPSPLSPLLAKAQEMQTMAMTMIQTAASLMSAYQTENPNELWNIMDPRNNAVMTPYRGRGGFNRAAHRFKHRGRRYFNGNRETVPYRHHQRWPHHSKQENWTEPDTHHSVISPNDNVVEIIDSDDENIVGSTSISRKRRDYSGLDSLNQKRLKTEKAIDVIEIADEVSSPKRHIPSTLNEDSNNKLDVKIENEVKIESLNETKEEKNEVTKSVLSSSAEPIKIEKSNIKNTELSKKDSNVVDNQNKDKTERIATAATEKIEVVSDNLIISSRESSKSPTDQLSKSDKKTEETRDPLDLSIISLEANIPGDNKATSDEDCEEVIDCDTSETSCINLDSDEGSDEEEDSDSVSETDGPSTWEEYKENPREENDLVGEATLHLPHSTNYSSILRALQIFKDIKTQYTKNKFKIIYDVYLPTTKFKKSIKTLPDYRAVIVKAEDSLPSPSEIENLKNEYSDNIPFLFSIVTEASINFFQYGSVYLPTHD